MTANIAVKYTLLLSKRPPYKNHTKMKTIVPLLVAIRSRDGYCLINLRKRKLACIMDSWSAIQLFYLCFYTSIYGMLIKTTKTWGLFFTGFLLLFPFLRAVILTQHENYVKTIYCIKSIAACY